MFEIKGYVFLPRGNNVEKMPLKNTFLVESYEKAIEMFQAYGIERYIFILKKVKQ